VLWLCFWDVTLIFVRRFAVGFLLLIDFLIQWWVCFAFTGHTSRHNWRRFCTLYQFISWLRAAAANGITVVIYLPWWNYGWIKRWNVLRNIPPLVSTPSHSIYLICMASFTQNSVYSGWVADVIGIFFPLHSCWKYVSTVLEYMWERKRVYIAAFLEDKKRHKQNSA